MFDIHILGFHLRSGLAVYGVPYHTNLTKSSVPSKKINDKLKSQFDVKCYFKDTHSTHFIGMDIETEKLETLSP